MRFETIIAGQYLAGRLEQTAIIKTVRDDGDVIMLDLHSGERVMLLLIERTINLADVQFHYQTNSAQGIYTAMFLWVDMFLPRDGAALDMTDWMRALSALHGHLLFGYEIAGRDAFFFPIHIRGMGDKKSVHYGDVIQYGRLGCKSVMVDLPFWKGEWQVAGFSAVGQSTFVEQVDHPLKRYFDILGLATDAQSDRVKQAYRTLAKRYHPDMNPDDMNDERMKNLNEAYQLIMRSFDDSA